MTKTFRRQALLITLALGATSVAHASSLTLGEQYVLRSYTGQAMGQALTDIIKAQRIALVTNTSSICASLTGAIGAQVVSQPASREGLRGASLAAPADAVRLADTVKGSDAVALLFGGQTPAEENYALVKAALQALAEQNYPGAILLHVRVWLPKMAQRAAAEDAKIAQYLAGKQNVYTVTVAADEGRARVHRVAINANEQRSVQVLHEMTMNPVWLELFKRSI